MSRSPSRSPNGRRGGGYESSPLRKGQVVEARYRGKGRWCGGIVRRVKTDGTVEVLYDDGEYDDNLPRRCVRIVPMNEVRTFEKRQRVRARFQGRGDWKMGEITRVREHNQYDVEYDNGAKEFNVDARFIENCVKSSDSDDDVGGGRLVVGSRVKARYRGKSKFYPGVITRDRRDGTYDIDYDDGEQETRVKEELIEAEGGGGAGGRKKKSGFDSDDDVGGGRLVVGSRVKARYRGKSKFYPGVITRDRGDGTYDIDYDDGEKEYRVKEELIEAEGGGGSSGRTSVARDDMSSRLGATRNLGGGSPEFARSGRKMLVQSPAKKRGGST